MTVTWKVTCYPSQEFIILSLWPVLWNILRTYRSKLEYWSLSATSSVVWYLQARLGIYPFECNSMKGSNWVSSNLAYKCQTRVEVNESDKPCSLLQYRINNGHKKFYIVSPQAFDYYKSDEWAFCWFAVNYLAMYITLDHAPRGCTIKLFTAIIIAVSSQ